MKKSLFTIIAIVSLSLGISCSSDDENDDYNIVLVEKSKFPEWAKQKITFPTQDQDRIIDVDIYKGQYEGKMLYAIMTPFFNFPEIYTSDGDYYNRYDYKELFNSKKRWTLIFTHRNSATPVETIESAMNFWTKLNQENK